MIRNEYRRAFIMLRAAGQGYGGHARLERRTMTGSMYFVVTAPEGAGPLRAALAGQRDGVYYAASLGTLSRDRRGQLTLAWQFDPRSIDGRPLEAYAWVVVADTGNGCAAVLTGNVEGSRSVDPFALEGAVCALFAAGTAPAADLPEPDGLPRSTEPATLPAAEENVAEMPEDTGPAEVEDSFQEDVKIYTARRCRVCAGEGSNSVPAEAPPEAGDVSIREAKASTSLGGPEAVSDAERPDIAPLPADGAAAGEALPEVPGTPYAEPETAARRLGLDISQAWPAALEPLRRLFATQPPLQNAPDGEYTYISAPMPPESGFTACLVGIRAQAGRPTGLRYALPSRYSPLPPAGLESYRWLGGGGEGFWVLDTQAD